MPFIWNIYLGHVASRAFLYFKRVSIAYGSELYSFIEDLEIIPAFVRKSPQFYLFFEIFILVRSPFVACIANNALLSHMVGNFELSTTIYGYIAPLHQKIRLITPGILHIAVFPLLTGNWCLLDVNNGEQWAFYLYPFLIKRCDLSRALKIGLLIETIPSEQYDVIIIVFWLYFIS